MSLFSQYSTYQILLRLLPHNWDLVQAPSQGTSAIGTGEESKNPPLPPYNPLRSQNRPHLSCCLTIIGLQVPTNTKPGSKHRPQDTSGHPKGQKTFFSGDWIRQVKSLHSICHNMAPTPISASSSMPSLGLNQSFVGTFSGLSQLTAKMDKDLQPSGHDSVDSSKGVYDSALPDKTNFSSV
ncbi:hypothetical protein O181_048370 [Austropuccinia psidii MF-1]|uniref:Uncharacterized protein n=1 Tax=Austropuccinia psidii MF-1 TaxID=1389203 RepID=A0A9Q3DX57_9BASI|nr:hypothetical protein [Austropuccinia psidii MF-1]